MRSPRHWSFPIAGPPCSPGDHTDAALADPTVRPAVRSQLLEGLATLDRLARRQGRRAFASLPGARRDQVLSAFERTPAGHAVIEGFITDVTESQRLSEQLSHQAAHDAARAIDAIDTDAAGERFID